MARQELYELVAPSLQALSQSDVEDGRRYVLHNDQLELSLPGFLPQLFADSVIDLH
jgi:hypothetical protein